MSDTGTKHRLETLHTPEQADIDGVLEYVGSIQIGIFDIGRHPLLTESRQRHSSAWTVWRSEADLVPYS
jgi:hypothetical protein